MTEFKVGDRVVARETSEGNGIKAGEEYTVSGVEPSQVIAERLLSVDGPGDRSTRQVFSSRFYRVEPEPKFQKGDRVRITLEGEVQRVFASGALSLAGPDFGSSVDAAHIVNAEKIEPPVVTFGVGKTVRSKKTGRIYSVSTDGYYSHEAARHVKAPDAVFTSKGYDLVLLR